MPRLLCAWVGKRAQFISIAVLLPDPQPLGLLIGADEN